MTNLLLFLVFVIAQQYRAKADEISQPVRLAHSSVASSCGRGWQEEYTKLHQDIISGRLPPRYLVSVAPPTGFADKLKALITELVWAMLSRRAFVALPAEDFPAWDKILEVKNINITAPAEFNIPFEQWRKWCKRRPDLTSRERHALCWFESWGCDVLDFVNLTTLPPGNPEVPLLYTEMNRGFTYRFFGNSYHNKTLRSWGLTPENIFACSMQYLFNERPEICDNACQRIKRNISTAKASGHAIIGVHIRVGDEALSGNETKISLTSLRRFFQCAADISDDLMATNGTKSLIYLLSDSISLLNIAKDRYGDRIIVDTETRPVHVGACGVSLGYCANNASKLNAVYQTVSQAFLFSLADYHVLPKHSGFGTIGAWMNTKRPILHNVYRVLKNSARCKLGSYAWVETDPAKHASSWSGI